MFDKFKRAFNSRAEQAREMRAHPGPPDIASLPAGTAGVGGLGAVPVEALSAYIGMEVRAVSPLDRLGPESSSLVGDKIRSRLREAGVGDPNLAPGEFVAGQNAARVERLRADGLSDEQIAVIQGKIAEVTAAHQRRGWTIEFANGNPQRQWRSSIGTSPTAASRVSKSATPCSTRAPARTPCSNT